MAFIILLGPPGSGKGTQAKQLIDELSLPAISTGDLIRQEVANDSPIGRTAKSFMSQGQLVPDNIIIELFKHSIKQPKFSNGFISDGFPRNAEQAESFDSILSANKNLPVYVFLFEVSLDTLLERILGRQVCQTCNHIFHKKFNPSKSIDVCDNCGGVLTTRIDDSEPVVRERHSVYLEKLNPMLNYYGSRVIKINAMQAPEVVFQEVMSHLALAK